MAKTKRPVPDVITLPYLFGRPSVLIVASILWLVVWSYGIIYGQWSQPVEYGLWTNIGYAVAERVVAIGTMLLFTMGGFGLAFGIAWALNVKDATLRWIKIVGGLLLAIGLLYLIASVLIGLYWTF